MNRKLFPLHMKPVKMSLQTASIRERISDAELREPMTGLLHDKEIDVLPAVIEKACNRMDRWRFV
jgi:hypothetical protein